MNKDIIKYALIAVGAYLVYRYVQAQGGIDGLLGGGTTPIQTAQPAPYHYDQPATYTPPATTSPTYTPPPALDLTGLVVTRDINNSLAGTVKILGVPTRLAIIQPDGGIYDNSGSEVSTQLAAKGVNLDELKAAFTAAGAGLAGFAPAYRRGSAIWLM